MRVGFVVALALYLCASAQAEEEQFRPAYHALPPANWMNDPNGPIYYNGTYHLFFQYNPLNATFGVINWGHMVSPDMIHWEWRGVALTPGADELAPDHTGCWTGSAAIDVTGTQLPTILYTGVTTANYIESQMMAVAADVNISSWVKIPANPVIRAPPVDSLPGSVSGFRDPSFWFDEELGKWRLIIGSGVSGVGGYILMYLADQLQGPWQYVGPLYYSNTTEYHGDMWECPDFFQLDSVQGNSSRWVLIFGDDRVQRNFYMIGEFNPTTNQFTPDPAFAGRGRILDAGNYYASKTFLDSHTGQRILWGWSPEARSQEAYSAAGWAGIQTIPRVLRLAEDSRTLYFASVPTVTSLVSGWASSGTQLNIRVTFKFLANSTQPVGLYVLKSQDKQEFTSISYVPQTRTLTVDRQFSSLSPEVNTTAQSMVVPKSEYTERTQINLNILVDHSIIEVIADHVACLTSRVYPTLYDADGVQFFQPPFFSSITTMRSIY